MRWAPVIAVGLCLAATGHARASDQPPEFAGVMGQFTLLKPAKKAPFREILDRNGMPIDLARFRGKVILLNFWATWCGPCRVEMPSLNRLQAALGGKRFEVVALSVDRHGAARVLPFLGNDIIPPDSLSPKTFSTDRNEPSPDLTMRSSAAFV